MGLALALKYVNDSYVDGQLLKLSINCVIIC